MPDPAFITSSDWSDIGKLLVALWIFVFCVVGFALAFLLAHAIVPSLLETGEIPEKARRARPLIYLGAMVSLALVAFFLTSATNLSDVMENFYDRWWI